jgi:hypothetical protein
VERQTSANLCLMKFMEGYTFHQRLISQEDFECPSLEQK